MQPLVTKPEPLNKIWGYLQEHLINYKVNSRLFAENLMRPEKG